MVWLVVAAGVLTAAVLFCVYAYCTAFYSPVRIRGGYSGLPPGEQYEKKKDWMGELIREMEAIPYEKVTITAHDGTRLVGRYYHIRDGAPLQIQFHGYRGTGPRDFCGGNKLARERGQNTLVVDQRATGTSGDVTISFGVREQYDCLDWVRYAVARFGPDVKIILSGVSMGAATVIMAAGLPELPEQVVGVIADSPYSTPEAIIRKVSGDRRLPPGLAMPFIHLGARIFGRGLDIRTASAVEGARKAKVPILIYHGEDDRFVPCSMSGEIEAANPEMVMRATFPNAGHGLSFVEDLPRYAALLDAFLARCLDAQE